MKVLNKIVIGLASLAMLTACASKVSYSEFHEKAVAAVAKAKDQNFDVTVNGKSGSTEYKDVKVVWDEAFAATTITHLDEVAVALMLNMLTADLVAEDEDTTYYAGSTFKTETKSDDGNGTCTWDKYGLPTSIKGTSGEDKIDITVKYSKK